MLSSALRAPPPDGMPSAVSQGLSLPELSGKPPPLCPESPALGMPTDGPPAAPAPEAPPLLAPALPVCEPADPPAPAGCAPPAVPADPWLPAADPCDPGLPPPDWSCAPVEPACPCEPLGLPCEPLGLPCELLGLDEPAEPVDWLELGEDEGDCEPELDGELGLGMLGLEVGLGMLGGIVGDGICTEGEEQAASSSAPTAGQRPRIQSEFGFMLALICTQKRTVRLYMGPG
jgi:hypothetical protein